MKTDIRVTAYIEKSAEFAQPILDKLREIVHEVCPEVEETIKWNFPVFMYQGKILCNMAAFKNHCSFGFWLAQHMQTIQTTPEGMGNLGKITNISVLPNASQLKNMLQEAMQLTEEGKVQSKSKNASSDLLIPTEIIEILAKNTSAKFNFEKLSNSHQKEYIQWIEEAKTQQTKDKRMNTMLEWLIEGKSRNWKYQ
jgi:uncharacterized protein YdeI (YjbR/CyaY-like superfamily)